MAISKTQCGWMALGGMLCLFGLSVYSITRDNHASAQDKTPDPVAKVKEAGAEPTNYPEPSAPPLKPVDGDKKDLVKPVDSVPATLETPPAEVKPSPAEGDHPKTEPLTPAPSKPLDPVSPLPPVVEETKEETRPLKAPVANGFAPPGTANTAPVTPPPLSPEEPKPSPVEPKPVTGLPVPQPIGPSTTPTKPMPLVTPVPNPAPPMEPVPGILGTNVTPPVVEVKTPANTVIPTPVPQEKEKVGEKIQDLKTGAISTPEPSFQPPPPMAKSVEVTKSVDSKPSIKTTEFRTEGEPPLAPRPGPVQTYHVHHDGETVKDIARKTLGSPDRWEDIIKLNPAMKPEISLKEGASVRLPAEACFPTNEVDIVKPLPVLRKPNPVRAKVLPLTGTFPCNLDEKKTIALPKSIREQLGNSETLMISPGPDQCLWVTNQAHLDRLAERLENSPAREVEVRVFKRLYYAQTERVSVNEDGHVQISDRLAQFAGLDTEVVLVGIDDHFELWDVARWKQYTQQQGNPVRSVSADQ